MRNFPLISAVLILTVITSTRCYEFSDSSLTNYGDAFDAWRKSLRDTSNVYTWPYDDDVPSFREAQSQPPQFQYDEFSQEFPEQPYRTEHVPFAQATDLPHLSVLQLNKEREPLESEAEFVTGPIPNPDEPYRGPPFAQTPLHQSPPMEAVDSSAVFQHHFGDFFNRPGGSLFTGDFPEFGFFNYPSAKPWWKGENVCVEREEIEEDKADKDNHEISLGGANINGFGVFNLNLESCTEQHNKYVCTSITNVSGRKRTVKVIRQCCHGFGRTRNQPATSKCEKVELYSVLETAEKLGASEFIRSAKINGLEDSLSGNCTIFVPTDKAFTSFSENMFENNLVMFNVRNKREMDMSGMTTSDLIKGHTVKGMYHIEDIDNEQLLPTEFENSSIRINVFPKAPSDTSSQYPYRYTANCVPIVKLNRVAENGIVHVIDRVLQIATSSIMDIIRERNDMTVLRTILEKTKLDKLLSQVGDDEHFTIFAPTDSAFQKLEPELRRKLKAGSGCATNILKNHILDFTFCSLAAVDGVKTATYNLLREKLEIEFNNKKAHAASSDLKTETDVVINRISKILETDLIGSNGVLHVIDTVLPTDSGMPVSTTLGKNNLTVFKQLLDDGGFPDEFDALQNVTYFVPSDKAFEQSEVGKYWIKQLKENPETLKGSEELKSFLQYHIAEPLTKTCDLQENMMKTKAGDDLRVNLYTTHPVYVNIMNRATVNCARLMHFDDESCGSVIHEIDRVLEPPQYTILQMLEANKDYSMFLKFIKESNLTHLLNNLEENLTVFVPKDDVFREVHEWYDEILENKEELDSVIRAHIVPDVICCAGIIQSDWPFIRTTETINNQRLKLNRHRRPQVQNAGVSKCDIIAKNGVVHEINDVISVQPARKLETNVDNRNVYEQRPLQFWF